MSDSIAHVVVSHGADFFGEDRYPFKSLPALAPWTLAPACWDDREVVAQLVAVLEQPTEQTFPVDQAEVFAKQLRSVARDRFIKPALSALARSLADAAARAVHAGEPWEWRIEAA